VPDDLDLLVVGSIALDKRDGPFGKVDEELGGSAVYFALAASLVLPVKVSAPVGKDAIETVSKVFDGHDIDMSRVSVFDAPTYRWTAHQEHGRTVDLGSADEIYDQWQPELPEGFAGWAFVGSMRPDRQGAAITELHHSARLLAADAMLSYVRLQPDEAVDVLRRSSWFFCNHEEYLAFGAGDPEEFRRRWFLDGLVLKSGAAGVTAYTADGEVQIPGLRRHPAFDTVGAGDALAGGMLARWLRTGGRPAGLQDALVCGVACASLAIESIGVRGIAKATPELLDNRMGEVWQSLKPES
jgi:sugar/nucleoside kinase (ribokinase family)